MIEIYHYIKKRKKNFNIINYTTKKIINFFNNNINKINKLYITISLALKVHIPTYSKKKKL